MDEAIDALLERFDDLLLAGRFDLCDELLAKADPVSLGPHLIVSVLSATLRAAPNLREREAFVHRARAHLERVEPGRVGRLLRGLA